MKFDKAFSRAFDRASGGFDWSRPCLLQVADFVNDLCGYDPAALWRALIGDKATALEAMVMAGTGGRGKSATERVLDNAARHCGWAEADKPVRGAIGVFNAAGTHGLPGIFDGNGGWLLSGENGAVVLTKAPDRIWVVS